MGLVIHSSQVRVLASSDVNKTTSLKPQDHNRQDQDQDQDRSRQEQHQEQDQCSRCRQRIIISKVTIIFTAQYSVCFHSFSL